MPIARSPDSKKPADRSEAVNRRRFANVVSQEKKPYILTTSLVDGRCFGTPLQSATMQIYLSDHPHLYFFGTKREHPGFAAAASARKMCPPLAPQNRLRSFLQNPASPRPNTFHIHARHHRFQWITVEKLKVKIAQMGRYTFRRLPGLKSTMKASSSFDSEGQLGSRQ